MSRVDPQIAQWFNTVDKDRTGRLSADQLQQALRNNNYTTFDLAVVQLGLKTSCFEMILIEKATLKFKGSKFKATRK